MSKLSKTFAAFALLLLFIEGGLGTSMKDLESMSNSEAIAEARASLEELAASSKKAHEVFDATEKKYEELDSDDREGRTKNVEVSVKHKYEDIYALSSVVTAQFDNVEKCLMTLANLERRLLQRFGFTMGGTGTRFTCPTGECNADVTTLTNMIDALTNRAVGLTSTLENALTLANTCTLT